MRIVQIIDAVSEYTGRAVRWACLALVLVLCYEVTARYVFDAPTIWANEVAVMLGGTIAAMGWAYTHRHAGHVRVDVFYTRLSPRGRAVIDVAFSLLFLFPLLFGFIYISWDKMWFAWQMKERLIQTYWYPPAGPIRTVVVLGLSLFALQAVAQLIRDLYRLTGKSYD